jgi:hypothetical protein
MKESTSVNSYRQNLDLFKALLGLNLLLLKLLLVVVQISSATF